MTGLRQEGSKKLKHILPKLQLQNNDFSTIAAQSTLIPRVMPQDTATKTQEIRKGNDIIYKMTVLT